MKLHRLLALGAGASALAALTGAVLLLQFGNWNKAGAQTPNGNLEGLFSFTNGTGVKASALEVTFTGSGGTLNKPQASSPPGCPAPTATANGNIVSVDWGQPCVQPGQKVQIAAFSKFHPIVPASATWVSGTATPTRPNTPIQTQPSTPPPTPTVLRTETPTPTPTAIPTLPNTPIQTPPTTSSPTPTMLRSATPILTPMPTPKQQQVFSLVNNTTGKATELDVFFNLNAVVDQAKVVAQPAACGVGTVTRVAFQVTVRWPTKCAQKGDKVTLGVISQEPLVIRTVYWWNGTTVLPTQMPKPGQGLRSGTTYADPSCPPRNSDGSQPPPVENVPFGGGAPGATVTGWFIEYYSWHTAEPRKIKMEVDVWCIRVRADFSYYKLLVTRVRNNPPSRTQSRPEGAT